METYISFPLFVFHITIIVIGIILFCISALISISALSTYTIEVRTIALIHVWLSNIRSFCYLLSFWTSIVEYKTFLKDTTLPKPLLFERLEKHTLLCMPTVTKGISCILIKQNSFYPKLNSPCLKTYIIKIHFITS